MIYVYFFIKSVVKWFEISVRSEFLWESPYRLAIFCEIKSHSMKYGMYGLQGGPPCDDLVIITESLECVRRLLTWKEAMEEKGLRVNAGKTKIMICGMGLDFLQSSGKFPCTICRN